MPYTREDYGRQFGNTLTDAYRKLNPNAKVPTLIDGDPVIWECHTILRYLAALHEPTLTGATPAESTMSNAGWIGCSPRSTRRMSPCSRTPRTRPRSGLADYAAQAADLVAQLKILDGHIAGAIGSRSTLTLADIALGTIVKRCLEFPIERPAFPSSRAGRPRSKRAQPLRWRSAPSPAR